MVHRWIFPLLFLVACSQPTEYVRDNPNDPAGASFELPDVAGLTTSRLGRQLRLAWTTSFNRYTIHIERSVNDGPFELRDTLSSKLSSWIDTSVSLPDSAVYRYRVFGRFENRFSDTLTSYRITSDMNIRPINSVTIEGDEFVFSNWAPPLRDVGVSGNNQTFYMNMDSVTASVRYPNGSSRYLAKLSTNRIAHPREDAPLSIVVTQHSRGREAVQFESPTLYKYRHLQISQPVLLDGDFYPGLPWVNTSVGESFFRTTNFGSILLFNVNSQKTAQYISSQNDTIRSAVNVTVGRIVYSTPSGKVISRVLQTDTRTPMDVPGHATTLGAYYETGEIVYVKRNPNRPDSASIDRFNIFTQTLLASFPTESTSPLRLIDRPELNEIWIFDRGLRRIHRTTGALLQDFDSSTPLKHVLFRNGKAFGTFANRAAFVKNYDLTTGAVAEFAFPSTHHHALYLSDGDHVAYRTSNDFRLYQLSANRTVAVSNTFGIPGLDFFVPTNQSGLSGIDLYYPLSGHNLMKFILGPETYTFTQFP